MRMGGCCLALVVGAIAMVLARVSAADTPPDPGFDFSGYRIPAQSWRSWFVNGAGAGYSTSLDAPTNTAHLRNANGSLLVDLDSGHDSDPLYYDWGFSLGATGEGDFNKS